MWSWDEEAVSAFAFLRFCEETGIPFRIRNSTFGRKSAEGTLLRIAKYSPYWAMATMIRLGDEKVVDQIFNRESLYMMDVALVDNLIDGYLMAIKESQADIHSGSDFYTDNFGILLAQVVPEILSRLCCKSSLNAKGKLLDFLLGVYISEQRNKYRGISHLTERLLQSYSYCQQFELVPKLLEFPVLDNLHPRTKNEFINPFYFLSH